MTGTNHMVVGALIGSSITAPELALPLAFISHFILDVLPHYGDDTISWASRRKKLIVGLDTAFAALFLLLIVALQPAHWPFMFAGALLAMSPDLMWLPNYVRALRGTEKRAANFIMRIHKRMQWGERPWGLIVEAVWFLAIAPFFYFALAK